MTLMTNFTITYYLQNKLEVEVLPEADVMYLICIHSYKWLIL